VRINFDELKGRLLAQADTLIPEWLPGGKRRGREWICGNLSGGAGESLSVNMVTGFWGDFATNDLRGGDLISLYAAIHQLSQMDAARTLSANAEQSPPPRARAASNDSAPQPPEPAPVNYPPIKAHTSWGEPAAVWEYFLAGEDGPVFLIARYDKADGSKEFLPYTWRNGRWSVKGYPTPRPLYRLRQLLARPTDPVLIVEGEKAADRAAEALPEYVVISWAGGVPGVAGANWTPLVGRSVTIWPDADEPGSSAAAKIAGALMKLATAPRVMRVTDKPEGWDVADAIKEGWTDVQLRAFIAETVRDLSKPSSPAPPASQPPPLEEGDFPTDETQPIRRGSTYVTWQELGLECDSRGQPHPNLANATLIVQRHPDLKGKIWLDTFKRRIFHSLRGPTQQWTDHDDLALTVWIQQSLRLSKLGLQTCSNGLMAAASANGRNPLMDWLSALEWDRVPRLDQWLTVCLGIRPTDYTTSVGRRWLISMVARAFVPGCKADHVPVLEGKMGRGKSSALAILGGEWYSALPEAFGSQKFIEQIQGTWLVEIPDMAGFGRREHSLIISQISNGTDRYRAAYGRHVQDHPRTTVFAATAETDDWLGDMRGARRWWPLRAGEIAPIDLEALKAQRDQLFAEAVVAFKAHESWHETPIEATREEQLNRHEEDPWTQRVLSYCGRRHDVTAYEVLSDALFVETARAGLADKRRVASILRASGWVCTKARRDGVLVNLWHNPNPHPVVEPEPPEW
jgi:putative DNA primase/helicase